MTFYLVTVVAKLNAEGRVVLDSEDGASVVKETHVWDERDQARLSADYANHGVLHLRTLGYQHSKGRPLEWRGEMAVYSPYLVSIETDLKSQMKQISGPVAFVSRLPSEPAEQ